MCCKPVPYHTEKLYIHTNKYDVAVYKANLWTLLRNTYPEFEIILNQIDYKTLYAIFCYKDGIVRFTFAKTKNRFDDTTCSLEFSSDNFENCVNEILNRIHKNPS